MKLAHFFAPGMIGDTIALAAGVMLTFAFAPFNHAYLAILSSMLLLSVWLPVTPQRAFVRGFLYGVGLFGSGVYWVYISIHFFGNASIPLSAFITVGFVFILALFPAANGYLLNRFFPKNNPTKIACAFPVIAMLLEWVRTWIGSGFPWLMIGYSQIDSPLRGYAPLFSVFGVSLAVWICSGLLLNACLTWQQRHNARALYNLIAIALIAWLGHYSDTIQWTVHMGKPIQVSLVQGNIPQEVKWSPEAVQPTLDRYAKLTASHWSSKIIVWPEAAIPLTLEDASAFLGKMSDKAKAHHATLMTGIPVKVPETDSYFNAVISVGRGEGIYLKHRLVPFGEYMPLARYTRPLLTSLDIPMSDFIPDYDPSLPLYAGNIKIATYICYEIAYPELGMVRDSDISLMLTVSNDAWFGHSVAQAQHLQMAQMRSLENGRAQMFVSNDGLTATIGPDGRLQTVAPPFQPFVLVDNVQPMIGKTPWERF